MPTKILLKRSDIPSLVPHLNELELGEIALNVFDGSLYTKINQAGTETIQKINEGSPSELEKITEDGNTGWRILGRDPDNYGDIGQNAVDLSYCDVNAGDYGAVGDSSFAVGYRTRAAGDNSSTLGEMTSTTSKNCTVVGYKNRDIADALFIVGNGDVGASGKGFALNDPGEYFQGPTYHNALEVYDDGQVRAPSMEEYLVESDPKNLTTYETAVTSIPVNNTGEERIPRMVKMTQADYDAIVPDDNTLYVIVG